MKNYFRKELDDLKLYVPGKPIEDVMREYNLKEIIKLASNENPLGPSQKAIDAIKDYANKVNIYPDPAARNIRMALAEENGVAFENVLVGNGGEELITLIVNATVGVGDEVVMASPSFALYEIATSRQGGIPIKIPMKEGFVYDLDAMLEAVNEKTKLVCICNPNNPTGTMISKEELDRFVESCPTDVLILIDEAYFEYAKEFDYYPNGIDYLKDRSNIVVLRTFSKVSGLAGIRCGYIFSDKENIEYISKCKGVFNANMISQVAALGALEDKEHIKNTVALNSAMLDRLMRYFDKKGFEYVRSGTNFIFVNIKSDSRKVFVELQKRGVIIRPGFLWGYDHWIRVSTGTTRQIEIFIEALDDIL